MMAWGSEATALQAVSMRSRIPPLERVVPPNAVAVVSQEAMRGSRDAMMRGRQRHRRLASYSLRDGAGRRAWRTVVHASCQASLARGVPFATPPSRRWPRPLRWECRLSAPSRRTRKQTTAPVGGGGGPGSNRPVGGDGGEARGLPLARVGAAVGGLL